MRSCLYAIFFLFIVKEECCVFFLCSWHLTEYCSPHNKKRAQALFAPQGNEFLTEEKSKSFYFSPFLQEVPKTFLGQQHDDKKKQQNSNLKI